MYAESDFNPGEHAGLERTGLVGDFDFHPRLAGGFNQQRGDTGHLAGENPAGIGIGGERGLHADLHFRVVAFNHVDYGQQGADVENGDDRAVRIEHRPLVPKPLPHHALAALLSPFLPGGEDSGIGEPHLGLFPGRIVLVHLRQGHLVASLLCVLAVHGQVVFRLGSDLLVVERLGPFELAPGDFHRTSGLLQGGPAHLKFRLGFVRLAGIFLVIDDRDQLIELHFVADIHHHLFQPAGDLGRDDELGARQQRAGEVSHILD